MAKRLTEQQRKYCRCLVKVAGKSWPKYNPYAVCTASLHRKGAVRCGAYLGEYGFENFTEQELRGYAQMKKVPNAAKMTKQQLADVLYAKVASEYTGKTKNVWLEYLKGYRKEHPNLSYKEVMKQAAAEYNAHRAHFAGVAA